MAPFQSYADMVRAAAAAAAPQQQPPPPPMQVPTEDGDVAMEDAGAKRDASNTPDRAVLIKKLAALDSLLAKLTPLQADDPDVTALADEKRLEKQAVQAELRAGRPTRTLLKTATDQHDKAKKRQARAAEEERGLRVLLERAQSQQREAAEAVALHLDEITALERRLREEDAEAPQPLPLAEGVPPNVTKDHWNLFMAWMTQQQHAATQQQAATQQPCAQPQASVTPTQPLTHAQPPLAQATPPQTGATTDQLTSMTTPVATAADPAVDLARVTTGPFRARRDSRSRSQQEPYQPEKPPVKKTPAQPVEEYQFGGIFSDDEDE